MLKAFGRTDTGNVRENNQDDFNCGVLGEDAVFAVVCDGMGGENNGKDASSIAAEVVKSKFIAGYDSSFSANSLRNLLVSTVTVANSVIFNTAHAEPEKAGMGSTCKGSYTGTAANSVVATSGSAKLTGEELQVWYWAEVAQYRQENKEIAPDFEQPLDTQVCEIDSSVNSWQQYFLKRALSSWHGAQALVQHSKDVPLVTEEAYQPNLANYEKYMTGMPATEVLYGYHSHYRPNSMHQAYLDAIPQMLEDLAQTKGYADSKTMAAEAFGHVL